MELGAMAMPLSWKIGAAVAVLIAVVFAWNGISQYVAARHADEITRESARTDALEAQQARADAEQRQAQLAANLKQQRDELANTHQESDEQAHQYQAELLVRANEKRQEELRVQASYRLDRNQKCDAGIVINHGSSSFTPVIGSDGKPITCKGDTAAAPLR
jgi:biopolymer transport protein ExbB/TolQ